jgi:hypothetical protein
MNETNVGFQIFFNAIGTVILILIALLLITIVIVLLMAIIKAIIAAKRIRRSLSNPDSAKKEPKLSKNRKQIHHHPSIKKK